MFKKIMFVTVFGLFAINTGFALTEAQKAEGKNFDHGNNYEECLDNCRDYHHNVLKWPRGKGKGMCWAECKKAHPQEKNTKQIARQNK
jgi:hypothetical protein